MYTELPILTETVTAADRLQALKDARDLVAGEPAQTGLAAAFTGTGSRGAGAGSVKALIRLAEYITTGHDYKDTHVHGLDFDEALALEKFQAKQHRKRHEGHAHVGVIGIPREVAEMLLAGGIDIDEVIHDLLKDAAGDKPEGHDD